MREERAGRAPHPRARLRLAAATATAATMESRRSRAGSRTGARRARPVLRHRRPVRARARRTSTTGSRSGSSRCPTSSRAWCCSSSSTAATRSSPASPTTTDGRAGAPPLRAPHRAPASRLIAGLLVFGTRRALADRGHQRVGQLRLGPRHRRHRGLDPGPDRRGRADRQGGPDRARRGYAASTPSIAVTEFFVAGTSRGCWRSDGRAG